jgi:hypothetical protein
MLGYFADVALPPAHHLIPHLHVLHRQITSEFDFGRDEYSNAYYELDLLPYCLDAASSALEALFSDIHALVSYNLSSDHPKGQMIPQSKYAKRLSYHVDHFLDVARRAQNTWTRYLRLALRLQRHGEQLPKSLHTVIKGLGTRDYGLPEEIRRRLINYWEDHGKRLKDYRDLAQHMPITVTSEAQVIVAADGTPSIWLTLPNNPEEESPARLSFEPPVHAFSYVREQHYQLVAFSYLLCDKLIEESTDRTKPSFAIVPRQWLGSSIQAEAIPTEGTLEEITQRLKALGTT